MRVWVNGQVLDDPLTPAIAVTDHGFTVGDGVFEAIKVLHNQPFALTRHLRRLTRSALALGLPEPDHNAIRAGIDAVMAGLELPLGRIRITYTPGPSPLGSGRGVSTPTTVVVVVPMDPHPSTTSLVTAPWPRNERGATAGLKSTSYAENVIALAYAAERGATEALFGNTVGHICEGTGSNIFYVVDGQVRTPTLASGCLAGVTRELIVEWADVVEIDEPMDTLRDAEEIFLASTTRDVQGVHLLDDRELPAPGPVTQAIAELWRTRESEGMDP